jgi:putative ABC transport system ATP-binding protein
MTSNAQSAIRAHAPASSAPVVFDVRDLTKVYRTGEVEVYALRRANAQLHEGEISVLLGPSGSGKSTFLNILGGLDEPTSGTVFFDGQDLSGFSRHQLTLYRREHVGFVFQFYNLISSLTARENVALVTEISNDPMRAEDALDLVGLSARMDHFPAQLSGGEQQRVAIARAIAKNPRVLLCDEPTGALDSETGRLVLDALVRVNETLGTTTAIITHNAVIRQLAHRIFRFADGRIAEVELNPGRLTPAELDW